MSLGVNLIDPFATVPGTGLGFYEVPTIVFHPERLATVITKPAWLLEKGDSLKVHATMLHQCVYDLDLMSDASIVGVVFPRPVSEPASCIRFEIYLRMACGGADAGDHQSTLKRSVTLYRGQVCGTRCAYTWWGLPSAAMVRPVSDSETACTLDAIRVPVNASFSGIYPTSWAPGVNHNVLIFYV